MRWGYTIKPVDLSTSFYVRIFLLRFYGGASVWKKRSSQIFISGLSCAPILGRIWLALDVVASDSKVSTKRV